MHLGKRNIGNCITISLKRFTFFFLSLIFYLLIFLQLLIFHRLDNRWSVFVQVFFLYIVFRSYQLALFNFSFVEQRKSFTESQT